MLTIGQFSKVCQVSVKALHYYDKIGLLHPQSVDSWTLYRYYDESQIPTMLLIQRLKRYGFTLCEIVELLQEHDKARFIKKLKKKKEELERDIEISEQIMREMEIHVSCYERTGNIMSYQNQYEITIFRSERMPILSIREKISIEDFGKYYSVLFEKVAREKIETDGKVMAIYFDEAFDPECSDIELAVGVKNEAQASRVLEASEVATTTHKGGYSGLSNAYGAIMRYISENGMEIADAPFEIYRKTQFDKLPSEEWETDIFFPVRKK